MFVDSQQGGTECPVAQCVHVPFKVDNVLYMCLCFCAVSFTPMTKKKMSLYCKYFRGDRRQYSLDGSVL